MEKATYLQKFLNSIEKAQKKQQRNLQNIFDKYDDKKKRVPIPLGLIKEVLLRSCGECEKCGIGLVELKPDIHHKNHDPSDNTKKNLIVLCPNCHRKAHNNNLQNKKINITSKETRAIKTSKQKEKSIYKRELLNKLSRAKLIKIAKKLDIDPEFGDILYEKEGYVDILSSSRKVTVEKIKEILGS